MKSLRVLCGLLRVPLAYFDGLRRGRRPGSVMNSAGKFAPEKSKKACGDLNVRLPFCDQCMWER